LLCFFAIAGVESRLRTASLSLIKLNLTTHAPQYLDATHTNAGPHLIDEARDEERDLHMIANCRLPIDDLSLSPRARLAIGNRQLAI
jgi:hypothetical protein